MRPLIEELPQHYGRGGQDRELQRVLERMARRAEADKDFTLEQLFPGAASGWGLALWEQAYGIPVDPSQGEEQRRGRILAKVKGAGTTTLAKIQGVAQVFSSSRVEVVEHSGAYRFVIWYVETIGEIAHREDLEAIVNELKPAHLAWEIRYREHFSTPAYLGIVPREGKIFILKQVN